MNGYSHMEVVMVSSAVEIEVLATPTCLDDPPPLADAYFCSFFRTAVRVSG